MTRFGSVFRTVIRIGVFHGDILICELASERGWRRGHGYRLRHRITRWHFGHCSWSLIWFVRVSHRSLILLLVLMLLGLSSTTSTCSRVFLCLWGMIPKTIVKLTWTARSGISIGLPLRVHDEITRETELRFGEFHNPEAVDEGISVDTAEIGRCGVSDGCALMSMIVEANTSQHRNK